MQFFDPNLTFSQTKRKASIFWSPSFISFFFPRLPFGAKTDRNKNDQQLSQSQCSFWPNFFLRELNRRFSKKYKNTGRALKINTNVNITCIFTTGCWIYVIIEGFDVSHPSAYIVIQKGHFRIHNFILKIIWNLLLKLYIEMDYTTVFCMESITVHAPPRISGASSKKNFIKQICWIGSCRS